MKEFTFVESNITMIITRNEKIGDTKAALQVLMEQIPEPGGRALLLQTVINDVINTVITRHHRYYHHRRYR